MADIINKVKTYVKTSNVLIKYLGANIAVFLILLLIRLLGFETSRYVALPADFSELLYHPWTLVTYMFVHFDFLHILFNMLVLYSFGRLFLYFFTPKQLGSLYILAGLGGGILYLLCYNFIPYFVQMGGRPLIGASAAIMGIMAAITFYKPQIKVSLLFFGQVKLLYVAIGVFVLAFIMNYQTNMGGNISHIGGALVGLLFAKCYTQGKDITKPLVSLMDKIVNLFKPRAHKPKMKVTYNTRSETDYEYNERKYTETEEIDRILDKIKESGYSSLTKEEKQRLFDASKK
jgi:membrane associated rhomboid family serine protease